jgi:hypothetical protein
MVMQRLAARRGESFTPRPVRNPKPSLWPENQVAWGLFERTQTQLIVAPLGGVIGISHDTLDWKMKLLRIPERDWLDTFDKFAVIERVFLAAQLKGAKGGGEKDLAGAGRPGRRHRGDRQGRERARPPRG